VAISFAPSPTRTAVARGHSRAGSLLTTGLLAVAVLLAIVVGGGTLAGYKGEVVLSGSMRPAIQPGDLVIAKRMTAADIRPGQIVSFAAPDRHGITITHRVRSVSRTPAGDVAVVTRGDANNTSEHWHVAPGASVGRIDAIVPKVGLATRWAATGTGRLIVFGLIGAFALLNGLRWVARK
jgi:signal peptidase I